nr:Uncharacterised protein [Klebsiella pneumoniae]
MQTIGPAAALHRAASVLIDDDNFAIFDNVVNVAGEQRMGAQRGGNVVHQHNVGWRVQGLTFIHNAFLYQQLFNQHQTTFGQVNLTRFSSTEKWPSPVKVSESSFPGGSDAG